MAKHGGKREGSGRKKGVPKATRDIKALAQRCRRSPSLVKGAKAAESEQARIAALKKILDRGYGKATQAVDLNVAPGGAESLTDAELERIASGGLVTRAS
jgi:hypothetical protein